jgi:transposase
MWMRGIVMANFFREPDRRQGFLLPVDMADWVPETDLVHLLLDAVDLMDLSRFEAHYTKRGAGAPPFAPRLLVSVLLYAYASGHRSSRQIERLCGRDAGFRLIVGAQVPDHSVIARFRKRHRGDLETLFVEILKLCHAAGLVRVGVVALDGTKVKANAALDANGRPGRWPRRWHRCWRRRRRWTPRRIPGSAFAGATNCPRGWPIARNGLRA